MKPGQERIVRNIESAVDALTAQIARVAGERGRKMDVPMLSFTAGLLVAFDHPEYARWLFENGVQPVREVMPNGGVLPQVVDAWVREFSTGVLGEEEA